jgi:hypothetical protein
MADYYSILASAVRALDPNTLSARWRLYKRARSALVSEMQNADPPIPRSEIMVAQMALEAAIDEVEADAGPEPLNVATEKYDDPCEGVHPVSTAKPVPRRVSTASVRYQKIDRRGSRARIWKLFRWRSNDDVEVGEQGGLGEHRDTWLTDLLERASDEEDEEFQDFAAKRARSRNG